MPELFTFRAATLSEALALVRARLGPDAAVIETRDVGLALLRLAGAQTIEIVASADVDVPSRLPNGDRSKNSIALHAADEHDYRQRIRQNLLASGRWETSLVERLASKNHPAMQQLPHPFQQDDS